MRFASFAVGAKRPIISERYWLRQVSALSSPRRERYLMNKKATQLMF
jgi:hypothetical protein